MTTVVSGRCRRRIDRGSFADITEAEVLDIAPAGGEVAVTFAGALTDGQVAAVANRMDSTGPENEAARASLRADCDALPDGPLRRLIDYVLGE